MEVSKFMVDVHLLRVYKKERCQGLEILVVRRVDCLWLVGTRAIPQHLTTVLPFVPSVSETRNLTSDHTFRLLFVLLLMFYKCFTITDTSFITHCLWLRLSFYRPKSTQDSSTINSILGILLFWGRISSFLSSLPSVIFPSFSFTLTVPLPSVCVNSVTNCCTGFRTPFFLEY